MTLLGVAILDTSRDDVKLAHLSMWLNCLLRSRDAPASRP